MAETLGQAVLEVGVDDSRLRAGLQGVEQQARRTADVVNSIFVAGGIVAGAIAAARSFGGLIAAASELEGITRKLANTLGDQGAQKALGDLRSLSERLGISFTVLADSFGSFTAAASAAGISLSVQKDLFEAVSTSAQRLGLSNDAINGSLLALQQVAAKGTVQMEELRGQLGERLPTAFAATAQGLGITSRELIKLVESGKLTADQFFPALTKGLTELNGSGGGGVLTAEQNFATFGDRLKDLQAEFGKDFLPGVIATVKQLTELLKEISIQKRAADIGGSFGLRGTEADQIVGRQIDVERRLGLSPEQSKNIVSDAIAAVDQRAGGVDRTRNLFGQRILTDSEINQVLDEIGSRAATFSKPAREQAAKEERRIASAAEEDRRQASLLNTPGKIEERLKALRAENKGLDFGSTKFAENQAEITRLQGLTEKGAQTIQKAQEDAARKSKEVADNYLKAADAAKSTAQSFAETVAGSRFASESAQRQARDTLERRATETLNSGAVNRDAVAREFGLPITQNGSLDIQGGGQRFRESFTNQVGPLDLRSLGLDRLAELVQQTAPLADGAKSIQESNRELVKATTELTAAQRAALERESNLTITVPVGGQRQILLP